MGTPKLKGICGGTSAAKKKYVTVNLSDLASYGFAEGEEVTLAKLKEMKKIKATGKERNLPLKVLGTGEGLNLNVQAVAFTESAKEKIEAAGGTVTLVPVKEKWTRAAHEAKVAAAASA